MRKNLLLGILAALLVTAGLVLANHFLPVNRAKGFAEVVVPQNVGCESRLGAEDPEIRILDCPDFTIKERRHESDRQGFGVWRDRRIASVNELYRLHETPYAGAVTRSYECPERFRPRILKNVANETMLSLYSTDRGVLGACAETEDLRSAWILWLDCPGANDFEVEIFSPPASANAAAAAAKKIHCD